MRISRSKLQRWWSIWAVGGVDHDAVLNQIASESGWSGRYAFLIIVSAALSLLGLLMPSVAVLIGAMLLSPLMMPIIGIGFGIATFDFPAIRRSGIALLAGALVGIVLSILFVTISPIQTITSEIAGRTRPTLFDLLVALLSAVAGAYALIRGRGGTVVGVAIAIALMPPLVVVGFGIATANWTVFAGSLLLFLTNAVTIALTVALVARVYGFGRHLSPHHTGWQLILFVSAVGLLAVPLGAALRQIAFEAVAQRQVRDTVKQRFPAESRLSQLEIDYATTPIRVRAVVLTTRLDPQADRQLRVDLSRVLKRPVDIHVDQLRVSSESGAAEAAQLARAGAASGRSVTPQERAMADLALIAGIAPSDVTIDAGERMLRATAAVLPELGMAGYRIMEERGRRALPEWGVMLAPPAEAELPDITVRDGVIDNRALDLAAWASERSSRIILVRGGTRSQRAAIADGITARGGRAEPGTAGGRLVLQWAESDSAPAP